MSYDNKAYFDTLRSAAVGSIGASYAAIGAAFTDRPVVLTFKNNTNGEVVVSSDGVNDNLIFPAGSYTVYDVRTNAPNATDLTFPIGTQFYVKDGGTVATTGTFYIEAIVIRVLP